jgi:nicotinamidase-related amidase
MFSARAKRCVKYPFGIRVEHACAIGHHLSGSGIALLIVDMINRFDSTIAMQCNSAHSFKIAATIHRLRNCFDAARRPRIDSNDSFWRQLAASASMPPEKHRHIASVPPDHQIRSSGTLNRA